MTTEQKQHWQHLSLPALPTPIFALARQRDRLWAGGVGGMACYSIPEMGKHQTSEGLWQLTSAALPLSAVTAMLALDEVLIAGGSEGIAFSYDHGQNWQRADLEDGLASITALAASPTFGQDRTAVAATLTNGILRTSDGGRSWVNASFGLENLEVDALIWSPENTLLAATGAGIYRSRDAGRAWKRLYTSNDEKEERVEALAMLPTGILLAALAGGGLLRSNDAGKHWLRDEPARTAQTLALTATSTGTLLWGTLEHGLLRSDDAGTSWQTVLEHAVHVCIYDATQISVGNEAGVCVSHDDGCTWHELPYPPIHDLRTLLARADHLLLAGTYAGVVSATPTHDWQALANIPSPLSTCLFADDDTLLLSSPAGLVRLSLVDGTQSTLLAGEDGHVAHIALRQTTGCCQIWAVSSDGTRLLYSPADGASWQTLPAPFGILPLVALQTVADRLLAATYDPRQYQVCLWYSTDDGQTWQRSLEANTRWPVVATCAQPAAVSIGNILFLEQAVGQWQRVTVGQDGGAIRRVRSLSLCDKTILLVLTTTSLQYSDDLGQTWRRVYEDLPIADSLDLALSGTTLYVLLTGGRIWQRDLRADIF